MTAIIEMKRASETGGANSSLMRIKKTPDFHPAQGDITRR
jgi:hypothetical protein